MEVADNSFNLILKFNFKIALWVCYSVEYGSLGVLITPSFIEKKGAPKHF